MARIFIDGFESGGLDQLTSQSGGTVGSTSGLSMDGSYCLELTAQTDAAQLTISAISEVYCACLYRHTTRLSGGNNVISFFYGANVLAQVRVDYTTGSLLALVGNTQVASSAATLSVNTTYFIETYYKLADSGGRIVVKLGELGTAVIDYTGDTKPGADTTFNSIKIAANGYAYGYAYYDNIILDTAGWVGRTYIQKLVPTGVGNTTEWTPSTGDGYACVDEIPYSDADYISTNTVNHKNTFLTGNLSGTIGTVKAVQVQMRVVKEGAATPQNVKAVVRSGSTDYVSADKIAPSSPATVANIWETDPNTSAAWLEANVNAMEIGAQAVT